MKAPITRVIGAFICSITVLAFQNQFGFGAIVIALICAALGGALFSSLHAFASISMRGNQIVSGTEG